MLDARPPIYRIPLPFGQWIEYRGWLNQCLTQSAFYKFLLLLLVSAASYLLLIPYVLWRVYLYLSLYFMPAAPAHIAHPGLWHFVVLYLFILAVFSLLKGKSHES
ncbi:hypothetical protein BBC27_08070 [Acidithiobacillus ferrivorans]|uniref:Uncharacterized protein n=1 Tax=Acidithiobacillus ferrivorans TaxID=160808 RepID=A0A1B9C0C3_9PROT|nr:hypothetical protein BBC27_08070 [Acidithiobacillus ferrivorans]